MKFSGRAQGVRGNPPRKRKAAKRRSNPTYTIRAYKRGKQHKDFRFPYTQERASAEGDVATVARALLVEADYLGVTEARIYEGRKKLATIKITSKKAWPYETKITWHGRAAKPTTRWKVTFPAREFETLRRIPGRQMLGPYDTRAEAEKWAAIQERAEDHLGRRLYPRGSIRIEKVETRGNPLQTSARRANRAPKRGKGAPSGTGPIGFIEGAIPLIPDWFMVTMSGVAVPEAPGGGQNTPWSVSYGRTLREVSKIVEGYIAHYQLGSTSYYAGNSGNVLDDRGALVAHISYNGRVWEPGLPKAVMVVLSAAHRLIKEQDYEKADQLIAETERSPGLSAEAREQLRDVGALLGALLDAKEDPAILPVHHRTALRAINDLVARGREITGQLLDLGPAELRRAMGRENPPRRDNAAYRDLRVGDRVRYIGPSVPGQLHRGELGTVVKKQAVRRAWSAPGLRPPGPQGRVILSAGDVTEDPAREVFVQFVLVAWDHMEQAPGQPIRAMGMLAKDLERENPPRRDNPRFVLRRDGDIRGVYPSHNAALQALQKMVSYSWEHAFRHEGWSIAEEGPEIERPGFGPLRRFRRRKNPGLAILNPLPHHLQTFAEEQQLRGPELEEFNQAIAKYCEFHGVSPEAITIEQIGDSEGGRARFLVGMGATEDVSYSANHKGAYRNSNKRGVPFRHEFPSKPHMATTPDGEMIVIVNRSGNGKRFSVSDWIRG